MPLIGTEEGEEEIQQQGDELGGEFQGMNWQAARKKIEKRGRGGLPMRARGGEKHRKTQPTTTPVGNGKKGGKQQKKLSTSV